MIVRKTFQYRLNPTKKQLRLLEMHLHECRWLYNELLSQRKLAYEELEISLTKYQQLMFLPELKLERPQLSHLHSQVLQNSVDRLDKAFQGFFRRCKAGEKAVFSDGKEIQNPRFFQKEQKALAKAQKKLSKQEKGTKERRKQGKVVAKIHERISHRRKDFCHQESRKIIRHYQYICIEDLNIKKMIEGSFLAKSITDASWNQFCQYLTYKAEEAGRKLGWASPAYTTQMCSQCKSIEAKKLSERKHSCKKCGYIATRDFNAAQNILALGLDGLGAIPRSPLP